MAVKGRQSKNCGIKYVKAKEVKLKPKFDPLQRISTNLKKLREKRLEDMICGFQASIEKG